MTLTGQQARAAHAPGSVAVVAGAGSGKTHMLVARFLHHLDAHGLTPLQVVAVTFTEKAAAELRARIRRAVTLARPEDLDTLAELEAAQISTIHGLCARIVRDHPHAAGVTPDARVLDEQQTQLWLAEHYPAALAALPPELFDHLPFSRWSQVLSTLLADPIAAERALQVGPDGWDAWAREARDRARRALLDDHEWRAALLTLQSARGADGDRIELARREVLRCALALEQGEAADVHANALLAVKLTGGSARYWPGGGFTEVKDAVKALRARLAYAQERGLTLTPGEGDAWLAQLLPRVREAFARVREHLTREKRRARVLDFTDLEVHALRALRAPAVREHYAGRWRAFLLDEVQDTNPVQHEILGVLREGALTTVVGDEKQSIYGFRRADVQLFRQVCAEITARGGEAVSLDVSFRTHERLVEQCNAVFAPLLGQLHAPLRAARPTTGSPASSIEAFVVDAGERALTAAQLRRAESALLARRVKSLLSEAFTVQGDHGPRPLRPGDVAVLARTWGPLAEYGAALSAAGVPVVEAGSGSLLDTREALDALNLLAAVALHDPAAIVATLRSPLCAVSDRTLHELHLQREGASWWDVTREATDSPMQRAWRLFETLESQRRSCSPSRLLQLADRLTGYSAVLANLWSAPRRLADWRAVLSLVRTLERGEEDVFCVVRELRELRSAGLHVPRPQLEAGDAVTLLTMHGAKGLEWPVVVLADLNWTPPPGNAGVLFDPLYGVSLTPTEGDGDAPVTFTLMRGERAQREEAESRRLLYVAFTRAREHLILTASTSGNTRSLLSLLEPGLRAAGILPVLVTPQPGDTELPALASPPQPGLPDEQLLDPLHAPA